MQEAKHNPIVERIGVDSCYLERHFYADGSLYSEVPVINGKETGQYREFYPNGQLHTCYEMQDGNRIDSMYNIYYMWYGDLDIISITINYREKVIDGSTYFDYSKVDFLVFYEISEYDYTEIAYYEYFGKWKKTSKNVKPVSYANILFRKYRREWRRRFPDIEF